MGSWGTTKPMKPNSYAFPVPPRNHTDTQICYLLLLLPFICCPPWSEVGVWEKHHWKRHSQRLYPCAQVQGKCLSSLTCGHLTCQSGCLRYTKSHFKWEEAACCFLMASYRKQLSWGPSSLVVQVCGPMTVQTGRSKWSSSLRGLKHAAQRRSVEA